MEEITTHTVMTSFLCHSHQSYLFELEVKYDTYLTIQGNTA